MSLDDLPLRLIKNPIIRDEPFPHVVLDTLWQPHVIKSCYAEFDLVAPDAWQWFSGEHEGGKAQTTHAPPSCEWMLAYMSRDPFLSLVRGLFDIPDLTPSLHGGGLHRVTPGGKLDMHVDYNRHPDGRYRRVNCLTFLNPDPDWTADLYLSSSVDLDDDEYVNVRAVAGRTVLFVTGEQTWHGHPFALRGEAERRSLAVYYFSAEPGTDYTAPHDTIYP